VEVISPVPYAPPFDFKPEWRSSRAIPARENIDGIDVEHPRFVVLPKIGWLSGLTYFLRILPVLRRFKSGGKQIVIHVHCAFPDAVGVALAARLLGLPYVVTAHGSDINVYAERPTLRFQIRWALSHAAGIIAVSEALQSRIANLLGHTKKRIACIPCAAFDPQVFSVRARPDALPSDGNSRQGRIVLFVGLLVPIKGVGFLVDAWAELRRRKKLHETDRLVLLGDGPERNALELKTAGAELAGTVQFAGTVSQAEVAQWIKTAHLLCLPSRNEGTPNVIIEALACGVPVVASRVGGIPDLIRDGENGLLVPPADSPALADAIESALERQWNADAIAESVAGRTWHTISRQNIEFIQSILHDHDAIA
jgi:glycosyltransferase involved in cell wall biosynthesis